jgi:hypothetical protein
VHAAPGCEDWSQGCAWKGSFSTQFTLRDAKFVNCNQALINWCDWSTVTDVWITTAPDMPPNTAVFENWNRLFIKRVVGVPQNYPPERNVAWIHNHAYRQDGGWIHLSEFRFGDESACPLANIVNFAPFVCVPHGPFLDGEPRRTR